MDYKIYLKVAKKLKEKGQLAKANRMIEHSKKFMIDYINSKNFDILVGDVREYKSAKFDSVQLIRSNSNLIRFIFKSGVGINQNTHRIDTIIEKDIIKYESGNIFSNRRSVNEFESCLNTMFMLSDIDLSNKFKLDKRTLYK